MALRRALRLVASATPYVFILGAGLSIGGAAAAAGPGGAGGQSSTVLDLNFADLDAAAQTHAFLAVAFYAPGCGRCRRLLPAWNEAAELLGGRVKPTGIKLARMDVTSRDGMRAWKEFGLEGVPSVKVFVDHSSENPLRYKGHLDAGGIAAHLEMLQRDRRRSLEHREKHGGNSLEKRRRKNVDDGEEAEASRRSSGTLSIPFEPVGSAVTLLTVCSDGTSGAEALPEASLSERLQEALRRGRLSLVLFMVRDSPRARHMAMELRKSAPLLVVADGDDHPTNVIRVDLSPAGSSVRGGGSKAEKMAAHVASERADAARLELATATGVPIGDDPELRIFVDGKPWIDRGTFKGMPTAEGIRQHMLWIATEAQLTPIKRESQTDNKRKKDDGRLLPPESDADSWSSSRGRDYLGVAAVIGPGNVGPLARVDDHGEMRVDAQSWAAAAIETKTDEKEISRAIKAKFEVKYGPTWHCIVGTDFKAFVTHESKHFVFFYHGKMAFCLYKAG